MKEYGRNRWYPRVKYDPDNTGVAGSPLVSPTHEAKANGPEILGLRNGPSGEQPKSNLANASGGTKHGVVSQTRRLPRHSVGKFLLAVGPSLIASCLFALAAEYVHIHPREIPRISVPFDRKDLLGAIKLQRFATEKGLRSIDRLEPAQETAVRRWNYDRDHLFVYPASKDGTQSFYAPIPRPGWEGPFNALSVSDFDKLKLYVIYPRLSLTAEDLEAHKNLWANHCGIEEESWIDLWSSWQLKESRHLIDRVQGYLGLGSPNLVNDCQPGGVCFVISRDCDGHAIRDFDLISGNTVD